MFELTIRLIGAGLVTFAAGMLEASVFDFAWKISLIFGIYSVVAYQLELKGMRNSGIGGFIGVADSIIISLMLARVEHLQDFGFLTLAPIAYAAARFGSMPTAMAPLAATGILSASMTVQNQPPNLLLTLQAGTVLLIGLLMNHRRIVVSEVPQVEIPLLGIVKPEGDDPSDVIELREGYRVLKERVKELEFSGKRDRVCCQLYEAKISRDDLFYKRFGRKIKELTKVNSVCLYTLSQFGDSMIVRSSIGSPSPELENAAIPVNARLSQAQMQDRVKAALSALIDDDQRATIANVLLTANGKVTGMMVLQDHNPLKLAEGKSIAEHISGFVASLLRDEERRNDVERRLKETELLYEIAVTCNGSDTPTNLASRVVREISEMVEVDHLSVHWIDGSNSMIAAQVGASYRVLDVMSFASGPGVEGWLEVGAPELNVLSVAEDERCDREATLRLRIGSLCVVPIQFSDKPYGYICASTQRTGGVDIPEVETLRIVAAEMGQALARLTYPTGTNEGLMGPREFQHRIQKIGNGCIVALETLRKKQLTESFGRPAIEHAHRQLALRLRSRLPAGGCICRRSQGDYVAFLPECSEDFARSWSNEVASIASMIGLRTPDGKARIPLAIRAKAAKFENSGTNSNLETPSNAI